MPILGPELVTVQDGDRAIQLGRWIAARLAPTVGIDPSELRDGFDLNDVVSLHLRRRGDKEELYPRILGILRRATLSPPNVLQALAGIRGLDLFVSLTFDSLLADGLASARGASPQQIVYSPNAVGDLGAPKSALRRPTVFHLLGKASSSPDYAICDEDLLEFVHAMQDKQRQPKILFDELRTSHLLILGCSFGDWLARFFLRTARNLELSQRRRRWDVFVSDQVDRNGMLAPFLESFSPETRVVAMTAEQFVTELAQRWHAAHPVEDTAPAPTEEDAQGGVPAGAIFVSYASDDAGAAGALVDTLRAAHLDVWFDTDTLQPGDDWARRIRRGIEHCSLFLPIISRQALSDENRRRYFWREWNYADDYARGIAPDEAFIVPIVIDDTRIDRAPLPDAFTKAQGERVPNGQLAPRVTEKLIELVREFHRRRRTA